LIALVNLPFGFWRGGLRKFTPAWLVAVHAPVPLVVALRIGFGIRWGTATLPILLLAYFMGQYVGARLRRRLLPTR
jgi:hypothetical protein